jgi:hypothetical protein
MLSLLHRNFNCLKEHRHTASAAFFPCRMPLAAGIVAIFFLLLSGQSGAGEARFQSSAEFGVAAIDEDIFVSLRAEQRVSIRGFSLVLSGPIRLRIADRSPEDSGVLRHQDWDEPSDFARIIPKAAFKHSFEDGFVDIWAGALNGVTVGMGTCAAQYFNSADMDRYQGGIFWRSDFRDNGLEVVLNNFVAPEVLIGRIYAAPISWFVKEDWARTLEIGFLFGLDFKAPLRAYEHDTGIVSVFGGELAWRAVDNDLFTVKPDVSVMAMAGDVGVHLGLLTRWVFLPSKGMGVSLHGEYRYSGSDYHPAVFNPFYDFNRFHYPVSDSPSSMTLKDHLSYGRDKEASHGFMADFTFDWRDKLLIGARYDSEGGGRSHWVMFHVEVTPLSGYHLRGFFAGQDLNGGRKGLFGANSIFGLEARGRIWGPLDLYCYFSRMWRDIENSNKTADEFGGGFGASVSY